MLKSVLIPKDVQVFSYTMEFVDQIDDNDEMIVIDDVKIFIDKKASLFLIGTEMDYEKGELESGFKFINPNEKEDVAVVNPFTSKA